MAYIPKTKRKSYQPKQNRSFGSDPFYNSQSWRKTSKALRQQYPICQVCEGKPSEVTDHIISRNLKGADYDSCNHLAMCHTCHNKKRGLEKHAKGPLIATKESELESKLIPVDKQDIIDLLNKNKFDRLQDNCNP